MPTAPAAKEVVIITLDKAKRLGQICDVTAIPIARTVRQSARWLTPPPLLTVFFLLPFDFFLARNQSDLIAIYFVF